MRRDEAAAASSGPGEPTVLLGMVAPGLRRGARDGLVDVLDGEGVPPVHGVIVARCGTARIGVDAEAQ